jgi:hypothetical protein
MNRSGEHPLTPAIQIDHPAKDQDVSDCPAPLMALVFEQPDPYE